ncbi:MAG: hypothetical protein WCJ60_00650 [bacterium]
MNNKNKNQPTKSANFLPGFKTQDDLKTFKDAWDKVTAETTGGLLNPNNGTFEEVVDIKGNAHIVPRDDINTEQDHALSDAIADFKAADAWDKLSPEAQTKGMDLRIVGEHAVKSMISVEYIPQNLAIPVSHTA